VTTASEFLCDFADVDTASASQRASDLPVFVFDEERCGLDGSDAATFVDEVFGILERRAGLFEVPERQVLDSVSSVEMQFECVEHCEHQSESLDGEVLV